MQESKTIGLIGGGFKPPTKGHLGMVLNALHKNPQIDEIIIFVGGKQRDTISQTDSIKIWNIYQELIPVKSQIIPTVSPIKSVWDYVKENPTQNILFILGQRGESQEDLKDIEQRTKGIKEKYPNIDIFISQTSQTSQISGTKARQVLESSPEDFFEYLPEELSLDKKQEIYNILKPTPLNENQTKFGYKAGRFLPNSPSETLKNKGIGLASTKVGLLGTGYYFFGNEEKAKTLKSKLNYNHLSKIDLSSYKLYRPQDPEDFYENLKLITHYIHTLKPEDIKSQEVQDNLEDAIDAFAEYLGLGLDETRKIFNQYIDDILNKRNGDLLSNRLLYKYDGIDLTNTSLDDFSVGSLIFNNKLKPNTYSIISENINETKIQFYKNYFKNLAPSNSNVEINKGKIIIDLNKKLITENATYSEYINTKEQTDKFLEYFKQKYPQFNDLPSIEFKNGDYENAQDFYGKTAYYNPNNKQIVLYTEGRHPKDIIRSLSHELIHFIQDKEGRLNNINTDNVNENEYLKKIEEEAYLKGNINFREWTDNIKNSTLLNEIGDSSVKSYDYIKNKEYTNKYGEKKTDYLFETSSGLIYQVQIMQYPTQKIADMSFSEKDGDFYDVTNKGELFSIMSTIVNIMKEYIKENPDLETFSMDAAKNYDDDYRRLKLYIEYIKKNIPKGWSYEYNNKGQIELINNNIEEKKGDRKGIKAFAYELIRELVEEEKPQYQIYSDMDGVITDFDSKFKSLSGGIPSSEYEQKYGKEKFWELISNKGVGFWVGMKWMPDGKEYWDYIKQYNPKLLSAPSRDKSSRLGKRLWVRNNLPGIELILRPADKKREFASPTSILIDDIESNINQWRQDGGIGILHTSAQNTIKELKKLGL